MARGPRTQRGTYISRGRPDLPGLAAGTGLVGHRHGRRFLSGTLQTLQDSLCAAALPTGFVRFFEAAGIEINRCAARGSKRRLS